MRTSKFTKRIISFLTLLMILITVEFAIGFLLEPISDEAYFNHDIDRLESEKADVDLVFVGASRTFTVFVPDIFEKELELGAVINAGSSSQKISGSYYQLKELLTKFEPEYVVLGVTGDALWYPYSTQANLIVLDRLHGLNRLEYIFNRFNPEDWKYAFLKSYRFRNNIRSGKIANNLVQKMELINIGYRADVLSDRFYADNGFVYNKVAYENGNIEIRSPIQVYPEMNYSELEYLDKIVELCEGKNIELFLVEGPTTMMRIYNSDVYQYCHEWHENYATEKSLIYHNLNYLRGREEFLPDALMTDYNHVNGEGAYVISRIYSEILAKSMAGENTEDYFYASFEELSKDVNRVVAVDVETIDIENGVARIVAQSLHNKDVTPLYQISVSENGEDYKVLVDWTYESEFNLDVSQYEDLSFMIRAKTGQEGEIVAFQCYP